MWFHRETSHRKCEFTGELVRKCGITKKLVTGNMNSQENCNHMKWKFPSPPKKFFFSWLNFWWNFCLLRRVCHFVTTKHCFVRRHPEAARTVCAKCEGEIRWQLRLCQGLHDSRNGQQTRPLLDHRPQLHSHHQWLSEGKLLSFSFDHRKGSAVLLIRTAWGSALYQFCSN